MTQAIYIGAGFDADAAFALPHIQRFIYSDGLPLTNDSDISEPNKSEYSSVLLLNLRAMILASSIC